MSYFHKKSAMIFIKQCIDMTQLKSCRILSHVCAQHNTLIYSLLNLISYKSQIIDEKDKNI